MSHDQWDSRSRGLVILLFAFIAALIAWDLLVDYGEGAQLRHIAIELVVLLAALFGIVLLWRRFARTRTDLVEARQQATLWHAQHRELLRGLSAAIDGQFREWQLTKAEAEVALFLLKGYSLKEIATLRETSERTAREQARSVYRKSGLSGRPSLAAFFLEDLLLPIAAEGDE